MRGNRVRSGLRLTQPKTPRHLIGSSRITPPTVSGGLSKGRRSVENIIFNERLTAKHRRIIKPSTCRKWQCMYGRRCRWSRRFGLRRCKHGHRAIHRGTRCEHARLASSIQRERGRCSRRVSSPRLARLNLLTSGQHCVCPWLRWPPRKYMDIQVEKANRQLGERHTPS